MADKFLEAITGKYGGTRLGKQELDGELLEDVPGALWQRAWIDQDRVAKAPDLVRILPELTGPPVEAYFVYPEELRSSKRISVFRDFLIRKVTEVRAA